MLHRFFTRARTSNWSALVVLVACLATSVAWSGGHTGGGSGKKLPKPVDAASFASDYVPTVLITGANRGIGLEFARQYAERGWKVIATARKPDKAEDLKALSEKHERLVIEQLDVTDFDRVDALAEQYQGAPIDLLLHNAGISGGSENQRFGDMHYDVFEKVLLVNTVAPLKITEAFAPHVIISRDKKIVTVSSSEGSITTTKQARLYFYRTSKTAVNMVMMNVAMQLKRKEVIVGLVNPGMTDTDLMAGLPKQLLRPTSVAVEDMIRNIDGLTIETTGSFYEYDGEIIPW